MLSIQLTWRPVIGRVSHVVSTLLASKMARGVSVATTSMTPSRLMIMTVILHAGIAEKTYVEDMKG